MPSISMQERPGEVHRNQPVRRLRRTDLDNEVGGVADQDRAAPGGGASRPVAARLAPASVCVRGLHDPALIYCSPCSTLSSLCPLLKPQRSATRRKVVATSSSLPSRPPVAGPGRASGSFHS